MGRQQHHFPRFSPSAQSSIYSTDSISFSYSIAEPYPGLFDEKPTKAARLFDVINIGGGPAGLAVATGLARHLVFD
jgi:hypothetical protein